MQYIPCDRCLIRFLARCPGVGPDSQYNRLIHVLNRFTWTTENSWTRVCNSCGTTRPRTAEPWRRCGAGTLRRDAIIRMGVFSALAAALWVGWFVGCCGWWVGQMLQYGDAELLMRVYVELFSCFLSRVYEMEGDVCGQDIRCPWWGFCACANTPVSLDITDCPRLWSFIQLDC